MHEWCIFRSKSSATSRPWLIKFQQEGNIWLIWLFWQRQDSWQSLSTCRMWAKWRSSRNELFMLISLFLKIYCGQIVLFTLYTFWWFHRVSIFLIFDLELIYRVFFWRSNFTEANFIKTFIRKLKIVIIFDRNSHFLWENAPTSISLIL